MSSIYIYTLLPCNISHNSPIAQPHFQESGSYSKDQYYNMKGAQFLVAFPIVAALPFTFALASDPGLFTILW